MKKFKKFTALILTAAMLSLCVAVFTACDKEAPPPPDEKIYKKNAVLLVTALTSGGLYDKSIYEAALKEGKTQEEAAQMSAMWDPLSMDSSFEMAMYGDMAKLVVGAILNQGSREKVLSVLKFGTEEEKKNNWLWQIILSEDGTGEGHNPNLVPTNDPYSDGKIEYGALAAYRTSCFAIRTWMDSLEYKTEDGTVHTVGDDWDVDVFNYDWRIDNRKNSQLLEEYINEKYPDGKVILTSHSMGGPVVAGYLARAKENRDRVLAYIPNSPAFYGSVNALMFLDDPVGCVYDMVKGMGIDLQTVSKILTGLEGGLKQLAAPLVQNMTSVMQLLPFPQFVDSEWYYSEVRDDETVPEGVKLYVRQKEDGSFKEDKGYPGVTKYVKTSCVKFADKDPAECYLPSSELYKFYCERPWAHKADGSLKPAMADLEDYWMSMTVDTDNDGTGDTFAPELVDTYYLLGTGINTVKTLVFPTRGGDTRPTYDRPATIFGDGDGTMPLNACLGGLSVEHIKNGENSHYYIIERGGHGNVGADWKMVGPAHIEILRKLMEKEYGELTEKAA